MAFTQDQIALRNMAATFAQREVEPLAVQIDLDEHTPDSLNKKAAALGLFGLYTPEAYGGAGADLLSACLVVEEIAKASPAFAGALTVQMILCPTAVAVLGTEEQKRRLLPPSASGERIIAYSQTEPAGVTNIGAHLTKLTPDGNGWRLNGAKLFCTQSAATTYLVMCRTKDASGKEGYGCVIVEREFAGFEVAPYENKLGWRGTNTGPISFNEVYIPPENILGGLLDGAFTHRQANHANVIAHAATSLGCAQGMFDKTLAYARERRPQGGKALYELQPAGYWLAEAHAKLEACRALIYKAAVEFEDGTIDRLLPHVCKAYVGDTAFDICSKLLQLWGGSGIMHGAGVNRYMRDAKAKMIAEGASEMHYSAITDGLVHGGAANFFERS
jgi:butyryl-CoA dehydrogenase